MQKETLQNLLNQLSQERANVVELKKKKDQEFLEELKQGLKDFIESFRKEFYPLLESGIDPNIIGSVRIEHEIKRLYSSQPNVVRLYFNPYWKELRIQFYGFMLDSTLFKENANEPQEDIIERLSRNSYFKDFGKELYEFFVEGKEKLIQQVYNEIHKSILKYNQKTLEITESLK